MYGCESRTIKKAEHWRIDAFELWCWRRLLRDPWPARTSTLIFIGRTDAEAESPILWPSDAKSWLIGKVPDAGKDWRQEKKRTTEDEMVGWHHRLNELEFEQTLGVCDEQGSLVCCSPWCHKEMDMTEQLNGTESFLRAQKAMTTKRNNNWEILLYPNFKCLLTKRYHLEKE